MSRRALLDVIDRKRAPDLVIAGGNVVDVHTREVYRADVAVSGGRIAYVGQASAMAGTDTRVVDAAGRFVAPGLIDAHVHTHESHLTVTQFARAVMPRGTTTALTDFYGEGVVGGAEAIRFFLSEAAATPLQVLFALPIPGYYQNGEFGHTRHLLAEDVLDMLAWPECWALNEVFASEIAAGDRFLMDLVDAGRRAGKVMLGHASEIVGADLQKWVAVSGGVSDHECTAGDQALEKARLGARILMREGSGAQDVRPIAQMLARTGIDTRNFMFCADLPSPLKLRTEGHIDHNIRVAVDSGIEPVAAVQMATLNAASYLKLEDEVGSIAPGKLANLVLVEDLRDFRPSLVIARGSVVAEGGAFVGDLTPPTYPSFLFDTVRFKRAIRPGDFEVRAPGGARAVRVRAIGVTNGSIVTDERVVGLTVGSGGTVMCDPEQDVIRMACIDRHGESGDIGVGFIQGFGMKSGAFGVTYNPQHENVMIAGTSPEDMCFVANRLAELGGGFVLAKDAGVVAELPLPILGLLSDEPFEQVASRLDVMYVKCRQMGCRLDNPVHALAFAGLPVTIGRLKLCCKGLVDVWNRRLVSVIA